MLAVLKFIDLRLPRHIDTPDIKDGNINYSGWNLTQSCINHLASGVSFCATATD
jgi:hypothetical protein